MLIDVIIVVLAAGMAVWGYSRGMSTGVLVAVGFGIGALLGSRLGPQALDGGLRDPFAPILALPAALLLGAALATGIERAGPKLRRLLFRRYTLDALGGALLAAFLGVVLVWAVAAAGGRMEGLEGAVRGSEIIGRLNAVLPPPGPAPSTKVSDSRPGRGGFGGRETLPELRVKQDPQVKAAAASVVKITVAGCGSRGAGSGWIAADGIVMTNAHVVHQSTSVGVRVGGKGKPLDARPIYFDENEDISVLRVPGASGEPALRINPRPKLRSAVAVLGFPFGRRYKARVARLGPTFPLPPDAPPKRRGRPATMLRTGLGIGPGASGGPVVDRRGRVVAMIFAATPLEQRRNQLGIPGPAMRTALRSALSSPRTVGTGSCHSHS